MIMNASFIAWATYRHQRGHQQHSEPEASKPQGRVALHRLPQAVLLDSRIVGFRLCIPYVEMTLVELRLTIAYVGACLAWAFVPSSGQAAGQNLKPSMWGIQTGTIDAAQLPLAVVLALKNNPITWLTGLGHEKLVLMHRVVSRNILLHTWLHCIGLYYKHPEKLLSAGWKVTGLTCFRRVFLISIHIHCIPKHANVYVWPVWVLWGFDRLLRWCHYLLFNVLLCPKHPKAIIQWIGGDGLHISVKHRIPGSWKAGQHVFLAIPALGIESHPFTIGKVYKKERDGNKVGIVRAMGGQTKMLLDRVMLSGICELTALFDGLYGHPEDIRLFSICIFIAGGTGVTYTVARMHQLFKDVHAAAACATRVVFIWAVRTETEYEWAASDISRIVALAPSLISLTMEVFLTGGCRNTVIEALLTLAKDYDVEKGVVSTIPSSASRTSAIEETCSDEKLEGDCGMHAQFSGASTPTKTEGAFFSADGSSTPSTASPSVVQRPGMVLRCGPPDVYRILEEEVTTSVGAVAVDVLGPNGLVDSVRSVLIKPFSGPVATLKGTPTVLLSVEQFRM
ncbi:hypothetical protein BV20DRAFT_1123049 [Pilatotrama ljubarskyi]|nr:hypothetical protein BV20DRAFT_1123049 [Pilatotrama ljubarskyi]